MKNIVFYLITLITFAFLGCKNPENTASTITLSENTVEYAKGFSIHPYDGYSVVKITNPWPNAGKDYTYVLKSANGIVPDSLSQFTQINIPIKSVVATSTTHIPSLEMLGVENTLVGFPQTNFISSPKVRKLIDEKKVKEVGDNQSLNTEIIIDLQPDLIIGYGIDNNNPSLDNLQKSGLKVILNGDWNESTPLGKAEWIKLIAALYEKEELADSIFKNIEKEYLDTKKLAAKAKKQPTVLSGSMYESQWYLPNGESWNAQFMRDANSNYLWSETKGTGSLSLSFETVLEKAVNAEFWIGPASFTSYADMTEANPHYAEFDAFKNKNIYSYSSKKGSTGGVIFYELAPNRPDLVLKDFVKIFHPELLPDYELYFFEKLK
ncbi:MAG: ABC transporter substrate-binding protein [Flavobacterium sp.]